MVKFTMLICWMNYLKAFLIKANFGQILGTCLDKSGQKETCFFVVYHIFEFVSIDPSSCLIVCKKLFCRKFYILTLFDTCAILYKYAKVAFARKKMEFFSCMPTSNMAKERTA